MKFEEDEMAMKMMMMESNAEVESSGTEEEEFGGGSIRPQIIAKRKRTKRRRVSTSGVVCNSVSSTDAGGEKNHNYESSVTTATTEEEEDMANCLILLARSGSRRLSFSNDDEVNFNKSLVKTGSVSEIRKTISSLSSLIPTVVDGNVVYECKTCDKAFQSFQALGGHRASHHKKPKNIFSDDHTAASKVKHPTTKTSAIPSSSNISYAVTITTHHLPAKVHECSICGSVFSSGQALGGHMRKHRATTTATAVTATAAVDTELADTERYIRKDDTDNNTNKFLSSLDLNKPAPAEEEQDEDDDQMRHSQRIRLFATSVDQGSGNPSTTAPPLVGCYF